MRENMDIMMSNSAQDFPLPDLDLALAQWNGKVALHKYRYPDGSDVKIRAIDFETDSDMEMFILRWVK